MPNIPVERGWLSIKSAAKYSDFCEKTIRNAIDAGQLKHAQVAIKGTKRSAYRIRKEWIDDWIERIPNPGDPDYDPTIRIAANARPIRDDSDTLALKIAAEVVRLIREA